MQSAANHYKNDTCCFLKTRSVAEFLISIFVTKCSTNVKNSVTLNHFLSVVFISVVTHFSFRFTAPTYMYPFWWLYSDGYNAHYRIWLRNDSSEYAKCYIVHTHLHVITHLFLRVCSTTILTIKVESWIITADFMHCSEQILKAISSEPFKISLCIVPLANENYSHNCGRCMANLYLQDFKWMLQYWNFLNSMKLEKEDSVYIDSSTLRGPCKEIDSIICLSIYVLLIRERENAIFISILPISGKIEY